MQLCDIDDAIQKIVPIAFINTPPCAEWKIYSKQDVMKMMKMTETTYNCNLKKGILKPMRLNGKGGYFEENLLRALDESRLKRRICPYLSVGIFGKKFDSSD